MKQIEKIKAEINQIVNRRLNLIQGEYFNLQEETNGMTNELVDVFINSLQAEPVSEDLELASERYACKFSSSKYGHNKVKDAVIWGANWQKEQMLKDAKYVEVFDDWKYGKDADFTAQPAIKLRDSSLEIGKQVKLIIIKED